MGAKHACYGLSGTAPQFSRLFKLLKVQSKQKKRKRNSRTAVDNKLRDLKTCADNRISPNKAAPETRSPGRFFVQKSHLTGGYSNAKELRRNRDERRREHHISQGKGCHGVRDAALDEAFREFEKTETKDGAQ
ncbi:MAG: hypothetical protein LBT36_05915 [Oscillospiraceae bacterium]|jgi:hypothetical protein|nr:hypothetical protein [Oscillospiraceae bacterium]